MNQTMRVPDTTKYSEVIDFVESSTKNATDTAQRRAATLEARGDDSKLNDLDSVSGTPWEHQQRNKVEVMKLRTQNNKPSVSPDKYPIGPNMVVNLAEPSKKMAPNELQIRMNQTSYNKAGGKANFFPSTATATTNGSSGNGSSDPRRTTDAGSRQPSISNNSNNQVDLNLQLRFNKN